MTQEAGDQDADGFLTHAGATRLIKAGQGVILHPGLGGGIVTTEAALPSEGAWAEWATRTKAEGHENEKLMREMGWKPPEECDCYRITRPLEGNEALPDHVCVNNDRASCVNWAREYKTARGGDAPLVITFGDRFIHTNSPDDWPFLFVNGHIFDINAAGRIFLVLRQWVEEEDERLGLELRDLHWVKALTFSHGRLRAEGGAATSADYPCVTLPITAEKVEEFRANILPAWRVPCTPGTARYLLWHIYGECDRPIPPAAPTHGVLVTSLLISPTHYSSEPAPGGHLYQVSGDSLWDSLTVRIEAARQAEKHREWFQKVSPFVFNRYQAARHNTGRPKEADALNSDIDALAKKALTEEQVVSRHLARIDAEKRGTCGRPATPQEKKTEREKALKRIRRMLPARKQNAP